MPGSVESRLKVVRVFYSRSTPVANKILANDFAAEIAGVKMPSTCTSVVKNFGLKLCLESFKKAKSRKCTTVNALSYRRFLQRIQLI